MVDWPRRGSRGKQSSEARQKAHQERIERRREFHQSIAAEHHHTVKHNVGLATARIVNDAIFNGDATVISFNPDSQRVEMLDRSLERRERFFHGNQVRTLARGNPFGESRNIKEETSKTHRKHTPHDSTKFQNADQPKAPRRPSRKNSPVRAYSDKEITALNKKP